MNIKYKKAQTHAAGFSLVELLTVIMVMSLLSVLSMPAINSIMASTQSRQAGEILSARMEAASNRALATNQEIWIGLLEVTGGVYVVAYDGAPDNAVPAYKPELLKNIALVEVAKLSTIKVPTTDGEDILSLTSYSKTVTVPGFTTKQTISHWFVFNPRGEMIACADSSMVRAVQIGLATDKNSLRYPSVLEVNGLTGRVQTARP